MKPSLETGAAAMGGITTVVSMGRQHGRAASPRDELGAAFRPCETMVRGTVVTDRADDAGPPRLGRGLRR